MTRPEAALKQEHQASPSLSSSQPSRRSFSLDMNIVSLQIFLSPGFLAEFTHRPWFLLRKRKAAPKSQDLAWCSQLGHGVLLLNINISIEHQHQTRLLCDSDGAKQTNTKRLLHSHAWTQTKIRTLSKPQKPPQMAHFGLIGMTAVPLLIIALPRLIRPCPLPKND